MISDDICKAIKQITSEKKIHLEVPDNPDHGDFATNVAMVLAKKEGRPPFEVAHELANKLQSEESLNGIIQKIETARPGFINFWLSREVLLDNLKSIFEDKEKYGVSNSLDGKKYLIEHTSPNTVKTLHAGHVRNNILGMTIHNLLEMLGAKVTLDTINNDRGIHVMKAVWAYQRYGENKTPESENMKPDQFVDQFYVMGVKEEKKEGVKEEMRELLRKWENGNGEVRTVWKKLRDWTYKGFQETYKRLGSHHDYQWFESNFYDEGREIVKEGLKKGIFTKLEDGAVLSNLAKYNLPNTIVLRADGTTMYHTQDIRLTQMKKEKFPSDKYFWIIGPEQTLYLKQLFAMAEELGIGKREDYIHLAYGFIYLKGKGKMSSRKGTVVTADWLMDEMVKRAKKIIQNSETSRGLTSSDINKVSEKVGLSAIKYGFLKSARLTDIQFDMDESLALEGNSGPYLQYTHARAQSILDKFGKEINPANINTTQFGDTEMALLRKLSQFEGVIIGASKNYSPNLLCNYLFSLAQLFNSFYNSQRILNAEKEDLIIGRVASTKAVAQVIKNGLRILGIDAPERM